ncbi:uncharacterized protein LOC135943588 [Cloeon dipterum]|uniref:uncharacterized protein LOC135943588 n=1 Tax=Cloeon dipterum TaxID=197152 RepID=UPI0032204FD8
MMYAVLAALCFSAQGNPTTRDLALDAFLAREEVVYFRQQSVVYSSALGNFLSRFDTTLPSFVDSIIRKLQALNINTEEIAAIEGHFNASFQSITKGAQIVDVELQNVTPTSTAIITSLDTTDWVSLREQNSNLITQINIVATTYDETHSQWLISKEQQENNLNAILIGQPSVEIANVLADWESITNFLSNEGFVIADENQIFTVRGNKSLEAIKIVLDQV